MKKMWGIVFSFFIALFCVILDDNRVDASEGDAKVMEVIWNNQTLGSYSTFSDALDAFNSVEGATIKVISDYDFTSDGLLFEFSSSGVLDLNGHILTNNHQNEDLLKLMILENSSLKIIDSADVIRETRYRYNPEALHLLSRDENGDVVVSGGIIDASGAYSVSDVLPVFWVYGSLELVSGNLVGISVTVYDGENYPNIKEGDNGSFVMRGGSILGGGNQYESVAVSMARDSLVSIYGGSIMYHNWKAIGVSGKLNIYGGTFKYNQTIAQTYSYEGDVINIYGGLFENNGICFTFEIGNTWNLYGGTFRNNNIGIVSMMDVFVSGNLIFENNVFEYNGATLYPDIALVQDASVGLNAKIVVDGKLGEDTLIRVGIVTSDMSIVLGEAIVNYNNFNTDNFKDHFASAVSGLDVGSDGASIYMVMANKAINYELNGGEFVQQCLVLHEYPLGYGARLPISSCVVKKGYSFLGWTSTNDAEDVTYISNVPTGATEDVTVYAKWEIRVYTIKFYSEDKTTLIKTVKVNHGTTINPAPLEDKTPNEQYSYPFDKWVRDNGTEALFSNISGDMDVYATYAKKVNKYTVSWINGDDTLRVDILEYGTMPSYNEVPVKEETEDVKYKFVGWDKEIVEVTGNAEYRAVFEEIRIVDAMNQMSAPTLVAGVEVIAASGLGVLLILKKRRRLV